MNFGELHLALLVVVDLSIKVIWLTSLISLGLMAIINACYLVIFDSINDISDDRIVNGLKITSIVGSIAILTFRQISSVRVFFQQ